LEKIWSTDPLKRLNEEIKRRADVVGVFPNPAALLRLASARTAPTRPWFRRPVAATAARTQFGLTGFHPATT
jgi:transposase-like protein